MGWFSSISSGFGSVTSRLAHQVNNAVHSVTGKVSSVVHTVETGAQSAVTGVSNVGHHVAGIVQAGAQGGLNALNTLGVPDFIRGIETSLVADTNIPAGLNSLTGPVLGAGTGLLVGAGLILAVLILK
jgi:phage-related protein